jgi:hypothetical protein
VHYRFVVGISTSKDTLMAGQVCTDAVCVNVEADDYVDARLTAEQMAACHGEPTSVEEA